MLNELITTYKEIVIIGCSFALISTFLKLALTYWRHYVRLMKVINWIKFSLACISFLIIVYVCIVF